MKAPDTQTIAQANVSRSNTVFAVWLRDVLLVAAGYFVAGYIGSELAIPPGYATIIWPASGVALSSLLLRGSAVWPGVWLGSFGINLFNALSGSASAETAWPIIAVAAAIACGASVQALAGYLITRKFWPELELSSPSRVLGFAATVVVLPCLIAATAGVVTLFAAGLVPVEAFAGNWITWAGGDIFGVLLVLPMLLFSGHSPVPVNWFGRRLPAASSAVVICIAATLLLTFYSWKHMAERDYELSNAAFSALASDTEQALTDRIAIYARALDAASAFSTSSPDITPGEWSEYVDELDLSRNYPGMRGIGFFEAIPAQNMAAFRDRFSREYGDRFKVHPDVDREEHFVINRIEPLAQNMAALGLDLSFEEGRRAAIALSRRDGSTTMTRPIVLVQDAKQGVGFLFMKPVPGGSGQRNMRWAYSPLVAEEFLTGLTPREGTDFSLEVFFGSDPQPESLMFATGKLAGRNARFEEIRHFEMANQPITLRWRSLPAFEARVSTQRAALTLAGGLVVTVLLGVLLISFTRREGIVLREVEDATAELEAHNRLLELAEATAHVGHWQLDTDAGQVYWSDEVYRIHGREIGNLPPLEDAINYYHPDDREMVSASLEEASANASAYRFVARIIRDDGELRHVEVIGQVRTDDAGEVKAIFGVIIDRTEETLMRESLTKARDDAQAADRAKTNFLANMSHEIRTPMNGVIGFTELALSDERDPAQRRRLQMISDSSTAMLRLLNDLLDFAKIEANQMAVSEEPTDLRHSLRSVVRLMEPVAQGKNIALSLDIDPDLPSHILIDRMRLRQVMLNLIGNAIKFTETGSANVTLSVARPEGGAEPRIFIAVTDTGIGIPANRLSSIFEKFTQADETTARRYGGTGLGLPISAQLVELMGGSIEVESEIGKGSRFVVELPLREAEVAEQAPSAPESGQACSLPVALRVLVAEDNPVNQEVTMAMVEKAGHVCDLARNGKEAVDMVSRARSRGSPYDLVLMDMQMPLLDGLGATKSIRDAGIDAEELPIVAVTANAYTDDIRRCHDAGMQAHIAKPLRLNELCEVLARWSVRPHAPDIAAATPAAEMEPETDPRLNRMFEERIQGALEAIDAALAQEDMDEDTKTAIASLLHQIAGVAGYFGQSALGERCREMEHTLLADPASEAQFPLLREIRQEIDSAFDLTRLSN